jgi:replicative DNA helicase Mcm
MLKKIITRFKKRFNEIEELISCIPVIKFNQLKEVRGKLRVSQLGLARLADVSQTLIGWYERGKIKGTSKSFLTFQRIKDILLNLCKKVLSQASYTLRYLELLADSDIFWDRVVRIKLHSPKEKWVYDLQVDETHNFVANNLIVHNSQLMQLATKLMPRARYASGSGITGAGITATVVRDIEFLGGWVLEAGALVLANKSLLALDEFTKISGPDMVRLQEAMSVGTVSIAKATIVATLPADTAILAGANPKLGRFDPYIPIREQIALNEVLLSRFDLRFALKDIPNPELDERMVDHILSVRHFRGEAAKPIVPPDLLRKYIAYARASCHPKLTKEAGEVLKGFYLEMRKRAGEEAPISITLRQYEALVRLAEASARIKLSDRVEVQDAERAIRLMKVSLRQFGLEPETGLIDIDRAEGLRITSAQRSKIRTVFELLEKLEAVHGKQVPLDELKKLARDAGIDDIDDIIRKMMREGLVYSPRVGFLERV